VSNFGNNWRDKGLDERDTYEMAEILRRSSDAFNKLIVDTTTNDADIAGHYEYNPQRWRLYKGSSDDSDRLFPEYGTVPEYNHTGRDGF